MKPFKIIRTLKISFFLLFSFLTILLHLGITSASNCGPVPSITLIVMCKNNICENGFIGGQKPDRDDRVNYPDTDVCSTHLVLFHADELNIKNIFSSTLQKIKLENLNGIYLLQGTESIAKLSDIATDEELNTIKNDLLQKDKLQKKSLQSPSSLLILCFGFLLLIIFVWFVFKILLKRSQSN